MNEYFFGDDIIEILDELNIQYDKEGLIRFCKEKSNVNTREWMNGSIMVRLNYYSKNLVNTFEIMDGPFMVVKTTGGVKRIDVRRGYL